MAVIHVTDREGEVHTLVAAPGRKVMEIIRDAGLPIEAQCGGACSCATCHVYVSEAWRAQLPEPEVIEIDMLDLADAVRENSRLSCQIIFDDGLDGLAVVLAPE
jgi:2Fe-2S ferredoxin